MAIVTRKASDLTGKEGPDAEFATVIVRQHPNHADPKALDVHISELDQLKAIADLVILEVQKPDGSKEDIAMRLTDLNKVAPNMDEIIKNARGTRGRLPGTRVGNGA